MKPPYIPPPHDHVVEYKGDCQHCGGPVELVTTGDLECRCCNSKGRALNAMSAPEAPKRIDVVNYDDVAKYIEKMQNGYAMRILSDGKALELESFAHILALNKRKDMINICVLMTAPGAAEAVGSVEKNVFPTDDDSLNHDWEVRVTQWENMMWQVLSFSEDKLNKVAKFFLLSGFHIVDGIPTIVSKDGNNYFPISTAKTYTIERMSKEGAIDVEVEGMEEEVPSFPDE